MLRRKSGFTLAELLIVVAIISILSAIAIPAFSSALEKSEEAVCNHNLQLIDRSYRYHVLSGGTMTLEQALGTEDEGRCPSGGRYSVVTTSTDNEVRLRCSRHGAPIYAFDFSTADTDVLKNNLKLLLSGMQGFTKSVDAQGQRVVGLSGGILSPTPNNNATMRTATGGVTQTTVVSEITKYFGADSNVLNSTVTNYRVAVDKDQNVVSVSYKVGAYGYIIYADGSMYRLSNSFFSRSPAFSDGNPILTVALDRQLLDLLPDDYTELR